MKVPVSPACLLRLTKSFPMQDSALFLMNPIFTAKKQKKREVYGKRIYPNGAVICIDRYADAADRQEADRAVRVDRACDSLYDFGACILSDLQQFDSAVLRRDPGSDACVLGGVFIVYFDQIAVVSQGRYGKCPGTHQKRNA